MPDPIDQWFPKRGPCLICGVPGADQRHRVIEAIADAVNAGDWDEDVARDYEVPVEAVRACVRWAAEHPDGLEVFPEDEISDEEEPEPAPDWRFEWELIGRTRGESGDIVLKHKSTGGRYRIIPEEDL